MENKSFNGKSEFMQKSGSDLGANVGGKDKPFIPKKPEIPPKRSMVVDNEAFIKKESESHSKEDKSKPSASTSKEEKAEKNPDATGNDKGKDKPKDETPGDQPRNEPPNGCGTCPPTTIKGCARTVVVPVDVDLEVPALVKLRVPVQIRLDVPVECVRPCAGKERPCSPKPHPEYTAKEEKFILDMKK